MPDTLPILKLSKSKYYSIVGERGIPTGSPLKIQNQSITDYIRLHIGAEEPDPDSDEYLLIKPDPRYLEYIPSGWSDLWIKSQSLDSVPVGFHDVGVDFTQRQFLTLPGVNQYVSIPEVTLTGNFEIEFEFSISGNTGVATIIAGSVFTSSEIIIDVTSGGNVRLVAYNSLGVSVGVVQSSSGFNDGALHRGRARMLSGIASISIDGGVESSSNFPTYDSANITRFGSRPNGANAFNGVIANVRISDNGTPVRFYPLDDNSTVIRNALSSLGANIYTGQDLFDAVLIGGQTLPTYPVGSVESGKTYIASVEISNYSGVGTVGFVAGVGITTGVNSRSSNGNLTIVFTATGNATINLFSRGTNQCTFSSISLREADGYGTYINGAAADWGAV